MTNSDMALAISVALEIAGQTDRGIAKATRDDIREMMEVREVPAELFEDVFILTDAFLGFAMNVRAAERKKRPIVPFLGETDLPRP